MSEEEKDIKRYGAMLPKRIPMGNRKVKSKRFSMIITDEIRNDFGKAYVEDVKKRIKEKENGRHESKDNI